jgi:L-threonylcarbamoyladenylate synthase
LEPLKLQTIVAPFDDDALAEAARLIMAGQPVAVPTETVYGLAADATSASAVAAIYTAKERPAFNPLIVHVADYDQAATLGMFNAPASALAEKYWPGPLTIVVPLRADANVTTLTTAGLTTIALRVPDHRVMQALINATGRPLAAPSANASGTISPTRADHVLRTLDGRIPMIIDDGPTSGGIESTIVKIDGDNVKLLRPGPLTIEGALRSGDTDRVEAPGQLAGHYAPSKPLRLNASEADEDEWLLGFGAIAGNANLSAGGNLTEVAEHLFDFLHIADQSPAARIAVASIPETGIGIAVNDRLRRAAAGAR